MAAYSWNWRRTIWVCIFNDGKHVTLAKIGILGLHNREFILVSRRGYSVIFQWSKIGARLWETIIDNLQGCFLHYLLFISPSMLMLKTALFLLPLVDNR